MHIQVDGMVKESGVFYMKTDQELDMEKRVKERQQELMEIYRAQQDQRKDPTTSQHLSETNPQTRSDGVKEYATSMDRRKERNGMEDRVHSRLYSDQQSASHYVRGVTTKPSSRLNSGQTWHHFFHLIFVLEVPQPGKKKKAISYISL